MSNPATNPCGQENCLKESLWVPTPGPYELNVRGEWLAEGNPGMISNGVKECWVAETTDVILYSVILLPIPWEPPLEN